MADLDQEFEEAQDLDAEFESAEDLDASFEASADVVSADEEEKKNEGFWSRISGSVGSAYDKVTERLDQVDVDKHPVMGTVAHTASKTMQFPRIVANLPGFIKEQAPKEWEAIKDNPATAGEHAAKRFSEGMSVLDIPDELQAEAEKQVGRYKDVLTGDRSVMDVFSGDPKGYEDVSTEELTARNQARDAQLQKDLPLTGAVSQLAGTGVLAGPAIMAAGPASAIPVLGGIGAVQQATKTANEGGSFTKSVSEGVSTGGSSVLLDMATAGLGSKLKQGAQKFGTAKGLREFSAEQALKSIGVKDAGIKKMGNKAQAAGDELLESGVTKANRSKNAMQTQLTETLDKKSVDLDNTVRDVSNEFDAMPQPVVKTGTKLIQHELDKGPLEYLRQQGLTADSMDPAVRDMMEKMSQLNKLGQGNYGSSKPTFQQLHEFKKRLGKEANFDTKRSQWHNEALKQAYTIVDNHLDEMASMSAKGGKAYKSTNQQLHNLLNASKHVPVTPTDGITGAIEQIMQRYPVLRGAPTAAIAYAGSKALGLGNAPAAAILGTAYVGGKYGRQAMAQGAKAAIPMAEKTHKAVNRAMSMLPPSLKRLQTPLANAIKRGPEAVTATNFVLSQQYPEYRDLIDKLKGEDNE